MGLFGLKTYILSQISHRQSHFESLKQYYVGKRYICLGVQSHPEDQGDFGQGLAVNISECNNLLELSVYNMCCSYMVFTNPPMKPQISIHHYEDIYENSKKYVQSHPGLRYIHILVSESFNTIAKTVQNW